MEYQKCVQEERWFKRSSRFEIVCLRNQKPINLDRITRYQVLGKKNRDLSTENIVSSIVSATHRCRIEVSQPNSTYLQCNKCPYVYAMYLLRRFNLNRISSSIEVSFIKLSYVYSQIHNTCDKKYYRIDELGFITYTIIYNGRYKVSQQTFYFEHFNFFSIHNAIFDAQI